MFLLTGRSFIFDKLFAVDFSLVARVLQNFICLFDALMFNFLPQIKHSNKFFLSTDLV